MSTWAAAREEALERRAPELADAPVEARALLRLTADAPDVPTLSADEWRLVTALARGHRMQGLLHRAIVGGWSVPDDVATEVASDARATAQQALQRLSVLREFAIAAESRGIRWLPYKGPVLSLQAYGDPALRPTSDIDLHVAAAQRHAAEATLQSLGFAPTTDLGVPLHSRLHAHLGATPWVRADGTLVELHWRLCESGLPWSLMAEEMLTRASHVELAGLRVPVAAPDDVMLALLWHGARHSWEQIEWLAAVAALARRVTVDWDALTARAAMHGGARAVRLGQSLLSRWCDAAPPPPDASWLEPLRRLVAAQYVHGNSLFLNDRAAYRHYLRVLLERPADRAALTASQLLLPTAMEGQWVRLPAALWPLYVPLRVARLALRAAGIVHDEIPQ